MSEEYVIVLSTFPADADPSSVAAALVDGRLAACVNIMPAMTSVYRWADALEQEVEHQLVMKTTRECLPALWEKLRDLHPYDLPEFLVIPVVDGNDAYLKWIGDSTRPPRPPEPA